MSKAVIGIALEVAKNIRAAGSTTWYYFKVEAAPPMTISILNGPFGKNLETSAGNAIDGVIKGLSEKIKNIEFEAAQAIKAKEAEVKRKEEERKAELAAAAKKVAEAAKKVATAKAAEAKASEDKKAAEAKAAEAKASEAKKAAEAKKGGAAKKGDDAKKKQK